MAYERAATTDPERERLYQELRDLRREDYRSPHFDEPNVLAHVRLDDRTIDGKRTLFVEEVQSDWHQEGRKRGLPERAAAQGGLTRDLNNASARWNKPGRRFCAG
jgi:hypothetical protein